MEKRSLGLIETWGYVPAVEAADAGAKAANVVFLGYEMVQAGLITIRFLGEVAAVKAAVAAGEAAAAKMGQVVAVHVIPRPDGQIPMGPPGKPPAAVRKKAMPPKAPPADEKKVEKASEPAPLPEKKRATPKKARAKKKKTKKS